MTTPHCCGPRGCWGRAAAGPRSSIIRHHAIILSTMNVTIDGAIDGTRARLERIGRAELAD
ncbi:MAG TPA: hypothetical protein VFJ58_24270, partial [Armatimonadota bacterium]|nr:hypothetical protein [Armatimonadota bacterium]